jgi:hypothetical protein
MGIRDRGGGNMDIKVSQPLRVTPQISGLFGYYRMLMPRDRSPERKVARAYQALILVAERNVERQGGAERAGSSIANHFKSRRQHASVNSTSKFKYPQTMTMNGGHGRYILAVPTSNL